MKVRVFRQFLTVIVRSVTDGKGRRLATTKKNARHVYFRLLRAFRIMPVKMLNMPAIMNRVVSTVLPMANWPVVVAI